jgi:hypothetical protein
MATTDVETTESELEKRLQGRPIGGPDGFVCCDSCNKGLADVSPNDGPTVHADTVHVYATASAVSDKWRLRRVLCDDCGPLGDGEANEPGEAHATVSLAYALLGEYFALTSVDVFALAPARSESEVA